MTTEAALALIDQVCSRFSGTREDHFNLQTAIAVLREATTPKVESAPSDPDLKPNAKPEK